MTRAQSMDVINDSTTMQSRIDAALSAPIMEWDHSPDILWQPGDPIWAHPQEREFLSYEPEGESNWMTEFQGGNYIRPMFQIIGRYERFVDMDEDGQAIYEECYAGDNTSEPSPSLEYMIRCKDCGVGWGRDIDYCWICGKSYPWPKVSMRANFGAFNQSIRQASDQLTVFSDYMALFHEPVLAWQRDYLSQLASYSHFTYYTPRRGGRSLWQRLLAGDERNGPPDTPELVTVRVRQEAVDRVPPLPEVFDFDLGLPTPVTTDLVVVEHRPQQFETVMGLRLWVSEIPTVTLRIPRVIPTAEAPIPTRVLDVPDEYVRSDIITGPIYPTSEQITSSRRRRDI